MQKPTHYKALAFPGLHPAVSLFAKTGDLAGGHGYEHVFDALARTSIGQRYNVRRTTSQLYVSAEFMRTIELGKRIPNDNFLVSYSPSTFLVTSCAKQCLPQRPVEWILWSPSNRTALIVISEEAELLIPMIRAARKPMVHLITYAAPVTKNMLHFNGLSYYVLPRLPDGYTAPDWLSIELGIFAGRLYINFPECAPVTNYLQLVDKTGTDSLQSRTDHSGIFTQNSVDFLLEWLTVCRKGQDIMHTPMGYICQGRPLHESHPFFAARSKGIREVETPSVGGGTSGDLDETKGREPDLEDE